MYRICHISQLYKIIFLGLLACFISRQGNSQFLKFDFESYSKANGLSQNQVFSIVQDKQGFMWFGTEDGLNRFDGYDFKIYRHSDKDPQSIISSTIRTLYVDDDSSIWIGTDKGVCRYYPETDFVEHFPIDFTDETKLNGTYVSAIKKHPDGSLWISYIGSGIDIIQPGKKEIFHYTIHREDEYKLASDMVSAIQFMPGGFTLVGTYVGIQVIDPLGLVLSESDAVQKYPWINTIDGSVRVMNLTGNGSQVWIGTEVGGLYRVDLKSGAVQNFGTSNSELTSNDILSVVEDSHGNVWIGSDALYIFDRKQQKPVWYNTNGMYVKSHTTAIFEDREQNLWIGTSRMGIRKFNHLDTQLRHYHSNQGENSIKSDEILAFDQDDAGYLWVGTGGAGLHQMLKNRKGFELSEINAHLHSLVIKTIYKDKQGYFWMGGWNAGLIRYHPKTKSLEQYHPNNGGLPNRHIWDIAGDQQGNLWLGTLRNGLCRFTPASGEYKYYKYIPGDTTALVNDDIQALHIDKRGILWIATSNGLSIMYPGSEKFSNSLKFKSNTPNHISNSVLQCIYEDAAGRIWLGTKGGGITIVNLINQKLVVEKVIGEKDGLPSNTVQAIQADANNDVWVSTTAGIVRITASDLQNIIYKPVIDLQGTEFLANSSFRSSDGTMFFGGPNGFYTFHPDSLDLNPKKVKVQFTALQVINDQIVPSKLYRGRKILERSISQTEELDLSYEDYSFTLHFSPVTYNQQKSISYAYFLENLDSEWQYTTSERRFVHYTNLAPGNYVLKVKASYDGVNWPEEAKILKINIAAPWWETAWFRIGVLVLIASLLYSIYKVRVSFFKQQQKKLEALVSLRTAELKKSNLEVNNLLKEVAEQKHSIEHQNDELQEINEELCSQRDALESTQFKLREINASLESLVDKRTQSLNNSVHELETFLYRASHDLRGPISSMLGLLMVSKMEGKDALLDTTYAELFSKAVLKLERTLQKLLQKYTIQKDSVSYEFFSKSSLTDLLEEVIEDIRSFRKDDFEVMIEDGLLFETDRKLMYILLLSLLENAFLYSEKSKNRKVSLEIKQCASNVIIRVTDHGVGIRQELKDKIFTMFFRGSVHSNGNGLGLYLVKCALEKLNGTVELESEDGAFSRFTVHLQANAVKPVSSLVLHESES
ncbi:two-component regulator propeller domain-containing protein [Cesiribacter sp. SM1]|uniref:two-component regulator propeller domain-containing protein n=1 Tax=Cesiribacter sp. SM1 TaxID=2861196 RepID=UPI001CD2ECCE|nr:two-component regulator propeller domain-containing protein [Cesiribacter sp. SM1]